MSHLPERIAAYHVTPIDRNGVNDTHNLAFQDQHGVPFDMVDYSRMKHGDAFVARQYGRTLADTIVTDSPEVAFADRLILVGTAYVFAPKPTFAIIRAVSAEINARRREAGNELAPIMRMHTQQMGTTAYAHLPAAERAAAIDPTKQTNYLPSGMVQDAVVMLVDDCVITGTTEKTTAHLIEQYSPKHFLGAYAIQMDPEVAKSFPGIEGVINDAAHISLDLVGEMIQDDRFVLNSRVLDFILNTDDSARLQEFYEFAPASLLCEMYECTMNADLGFVTKYAASINRLLRTMSGRNLM